MKARRNHPDITPGLTFSMGLLLVTSVSLGAWVDGRLGFGDAYGLAVGLMGMTVLPLILWFARRGDVGE